MLDDDGAEAIGSGLPVAKTATTSSGVPSFGGAGYPAPSATPTPLAPTPTATVPSAAAVARAAAPMPPVQEFTMSDGEEVAPPLSPPSFEGAGSSSAFPGSRESAPVSPGGSKERVGGMQKVLTEAFPIDKMSNGLGAAQKWMSWGFSKVAETATKIGDDISKTDLAKETEKLASKTEQVVGRTVSEVTNVTHGVVHTVQNAVHQVGQELQPHVEKVEERASVIVKDAGENAKTGFFNVMGSAARTAIWFQSLGAHNSDSEEDGGAGGPQKAQATRSASSETAPVQRPLVAQPVPADDAVGAPSVVGQVVSSETDANSMEYARLETETKARQLAEQKAAAEEESRLKAEAAKREIEKARFAAEEKAMLAAEAKAKADAEAQTRAEMEQAKLAEAEAARRAAEEKTKAEADAKAQEELARRKAAEEVERKESAERALRESEEITKKESTESASNPAAAAVAPTVAPAVAPTSLKEDPFADLFVEPKAGQAEPLPTINDRTS